MLKLSFGCYSACIDCLCRDRCRCSVSVKSSVLRFRLSLLVTSLKPENGKWAFTETSQLQLFR